MVDNISSVENNYILKGNIMELLNLLDGYERDLFKELTAKSNYYSNNFDNIMKYIYANSILVYMELYTILNTITEVYDCISFQDDIFSAVSHEAYFNGLVAILRYASPTRPCVLCTESCDFLDSLYKFVKLVWKTPIGKLDFDNVIQLLVTVKDGFSSIKQDFLVFCDYIS